MTTAQAFSVDGRRVLVVGGARSGVAAAELLVRRGASVTLTDLREHIDDEGRLRSAGVELELGIHRDGAFTGADLIVTSPGVPWRHPALEAARRAGVPVIGELELAWRWLRGRVVAITGTKGKSTTTTLTGRMLQAGGHRVLVGGNIGDALSAQVDDSTEDTIHVVEASSFQLEASETFRPWIAVLLNFSPDHLDRHAAVEEYEAAKRRIFANQTADDWAVLNADDPNTLRMADGAARRLLFSMRAPLADGVTVQGDTIVRRSGDGAQPLVPLSSIRLLGPHLVADVLAAASIASLAGVNAVAMTRAVEGFTGLEHALEPVGEVGGVRFVNDSKATNIEAARRAIESFGDGLVVILGGRYKGGDFGDLRPPLAARGATVIAIGEARPLIHAALDAVVAVHDAEDMSSAVRTAFASAAPGRTVVLAPACSSFDMFHDYAERGRAFREEVQRLEEAWSSTREQ
ncbi:MAG: UDP-N-acetylmuramoylalanine--D-glutamate ligase [Acidobacteria bacterium RIFCSPLOWO2_02_FULL_67_36]|nr:MAG: UDP-N-acetylmuramoylalanine--D-glutamate ligase [Acidobacteria bacterium RIFCSPLOWO2_02_FULL_67_36]OFW23867.1 MAG: UDP-N-acetylmuramoylalanine--D-glutamate ligase [Acidobacteria bacterium RIFCSPLOWO2_12_FULL_66_21]